MPNKLRQFTVRSLILMFLVTYINPLVVNAEMINGELIEPQVEIINGNQIPEDSQDFDITESTNDIFDKTGNEDILNDEKQGEQDSTLEINRQKSEDEVLIENDYDQILEEEVVEYKAIVNSKEHKIYSKPGKTEYAEYIASSSDYFNQKILVDFEVITESGTWVHFSIDGVEIGYISIESLQILDDAPQLMMSAAKEDEAENIPSISYSAHVQNRGWMGLVKDGEIAGTTGEAKRLEAVKIQITGIENLGIQYSSHVQGLGWTSWKKNGEVGGTEKQSKRLEAIKIELTGEEASNYDVYYRVHSEKFGWLAWAKNGEPAGTEGYGFQSEAIEIKLLPKTSPFDTSGISHQVFTKPSVVYESHVQSHGWLPQQKDGALSGTTGEKKRMEAIRVRLENQPIPGHD